MAVSVIAVVVVAVSTIACPHVDGNESMRR